MQNFTDKFFNLLSCGLWGTDVPSDLAFSESEWAEVYAVARRQAVGCIVYDAVAASPALADSVPDAIAAKWMVAQQKNEADYRKMSAIIDAQRRAWEKREIEAVLLKGHSVAALYREPAHRSCGDVDWFFPRPGDFEKANSVACANGLALETDSDGDVHYVLSGMVVEHHRDGFRQDSLADMALMLEDHVLKHAMVMGVGLKQVCDVAVVRAAIASEDGEEELNAALISQGLAGWDRLLCSAISLMGLLPYADLSVPFSDASALVELFLSDGNMGLDKKNRFSGFWKRVSLLARYAPRRMASRWLSLVRGRIRRIS